MENNQLSFFKDDEPKKRKFEFSPDKLILTAIFFIVCIIISYSIGVETGKRLKTKEIQANPGQIDTKIEIAEIPEKLLEEESAIQKKEKGQSLKSPDKDKNTRNQDTIAEPEPTQETKPFYSVQIATYSNKGFAERKKNQLNSQGLKSFLLQKGEYEVLYIGRFTNKSEAKKAASRLKKTYSDCLVKKIEDYPKDKGGD